MEARDIVAPDRREKRAHRWLFFLHVFLHDESRGVELTALQELMARGLSEWRPNQRNKHKDGRT